MPYVADNIATTDTYGAQQLVCQGAVRVNFDVFDQGIYYQLGRGSGGGFSWGPDTPLPPGFRSLERRADAVRIRSRTAGKPARVNIDALVQADLTGDE